MNWNTGTPESMGWYLVWTLNEQYDHLPTGWWRAWFDGKAWDKKSGDNPMHYHRVTHWMRIEEPKDD